ncbi:hypothetical protein FOZ63_032387 [Perkinsus olseni]|uniref:RRM domain-containing protein n=1 Tax=Perkinsus olseni TaxID=32597 RepID=A0A7J6U7P5_PEROL|nr:hypothetical protein FOZ63_032387 [Perkinsus olseni]
MSPTGRTIATAGGIGSLYGGSPSTSAGWPSPPPLRSISFGGAGDIVNQQGALPHSGTGKRSNSRSGFRIFCRVDCRASPHRPIPSREAVCNYFNRYGAILDCYLPESATNVAYVCFEDSHSLEDVMAQEQPHVVEGTQLTVTRAQPRPDYSVNTDRIFVKHVPDNATRMDLRTYFNSFGEVTDVYIPKDKATGAQRRFAFVTFRDVRSARAALGAGRHVLQDQEVQVMPAEARPQSTTSTTATTTMVGHNSPTSRPSPGMEPRNRTVRSQTDSILLPSSISSNGARPSTPLVPYLPPPDSDRFNSLDESGGLDPIHRWGLSDSAGIEEITRNGHKHDVCDEVDAHMAALASSVSNLLDSSPSSVGDGSSRGNTSPENVLRECLKKAADGEDRATRRSLESPFANVMSPLLSYEEFVPARLPPAVIRDDRRTPPVSRSSFVL